MAKILVVFYSRSGFTRKLAQAIAQACGGELEEIRDVKDRSGPFGFLRSAYEALYNKRPAIEPSRADASQYDLVVLGAPVWASRLASPARTYIMDNRARFKSVALFCTYGGSGADRALRDMAQLCEKQPLATVCATDDEIKAGKDTEKVKAFVTDIMSKRE